MRARLSCTSSSCCLLLVDFEDVPESAEELDERFLRCDVRREGPDDVVARRADDEALFEQLARDRRRLPIELDPPHEPFAADLDDRGRLRLQRLQLRLEPRAVGVDALKERARLDLFEHGESEAAGDRVAAEGRAVMSRLDDA